MKSLVLTAVVLLGLWAFVAWIQEDGPLGAVSPYKTHLFVVLTLLTGYLAVEAGVEWMSKSRQIPPEVVKTLKLVVRLVCYGLLFSILVSVFTGDPAAALTLGSFAGLVAGFAAQTVMGNTVAGLFIVIFRPIAIGDNVTISNRTGVVADITLMHTVLETDDQTVLIPSAQVASAVLVKSKAGPDAQQ